ncbi:hypothetical protein SAMN05421505_14247 [Sinosporangium album]|uniref:Uncharacterized protein n=1 Tax=Sinosporangium album TaxID=504805 RepID=A0A1G8JDB8_9ACTN|nr:hypothetical protein [Sinosporangium album]SDI29102.1 hypothetical protein SAMN05421505_14247 [Sinosporangium album]
MSLLSRLGKTAVLGCLVAGAFAFPTSAGASTVPAPPPLPPASEQAVQPDAQQAAAVPRSWISYNGNTVVINWSSDLINKWDWVALYTHDPLKHDKWAYKTWQWASYGQSYDTGIPAQGEYWTAYWTYDYPSGQYRIVSTHKGE